MKNSLIKYVAFVLVGAMSIVSSSAEETPKPQLEFHTKEYKVPVGFIPRGAPQPESSSNSPSRSGAREFLEAQGITFPEKAVVIYLPSSSRLIVKNTLENLALIERLIGADKRRAVEFTAVSLNFPEGWTAGLYDKDFLIPRPPPQAKADGIPMPESKRFASQTFQSQIVIEGSPVLFRVSEPQKSEPEKNEKVTLSMSIQVQPSYNDGKWELVLKHRIGDGLVYGFEKEQSGVELVFDKETTIPLALPDGKEAQFKFTAKLLSPEAVETSQAHTAP